VKLVTMKSALHAEKTQRSDEFNCLMHNINVAS